MALTEITEATFEDVISQKEGIVLLDFWAPWCGPCKVFGPVFEAAAEKNPDLTFGKINTQDEQGLAGALQIQSIPTLMVLRDGVMVFRQAGMLPAKALDELIEKVRGLDMDEVREQLAAAREASEGDEPPAAP